MDALRTNQKVNRQIKLHYYVFIISILIFFGTSIYILQYVNSIFLLSRTFTVFLLSFPLGAVIIGLRVFHKTSIQWIFNLGLIGIIVLIGQSNQLLKDFEVVDKLSLYSSLLISINAFSLSLSIAFGLFVSFGNAIERFTKSIENLPKEKTLKIEENN